MRPSDVEFVALCEADPDVMDRDELRRSHPADRRLQVLVRLHPGAGHPAPTRTWPRRAERSCRAICSHVRAGSPDTTPALRTTASGCAQRCPGSRTQCRQDRCRPGTSTRSAGATRNLDPVVQAEVTALAGDLVADAEKLGVDQFERNCRDLIRNLNALHADASTVAELDKQRAASKIKRWTDRRRGCGRR